ncbi:hypothetical protein IAT38_002059 [Cryptococcus sp. DSM 104549]
MRSVLHLIAVLSLLLAAYGAPTTTSSGTRVTRNDKLTNAERIARGLPVKQPKRLYDATATHVVKARASRGLSRRSSTEAEAAWWNTAGDETD